MVFLCEPELNGIAWSKKLRANSITAAPRLLLYSLPAAKSPAWLMALVPYKASYKLPQRALAALMA